GELVDAFGTEEYGTKTTEGGWKLTEAVYEAEQEVLEVLHKHEDEIKELCAESDKCQKALDEWTQELELFGVSMNRFLKDIAEMKLKTDDITTRLETQKELNHLLTNFID